MTKLLKKRGNLVLIIVLILSVILLFLSEIGKSVKTSDDLAPESMYEEKIAELLLSLDGINDVEVMVTLDEYGTDKKSPTVRGVSVVCHTRGKEELKMKITLLVSTALGISSDKIFVTFT